MPSVERISLVAHGKPGTLGDAVKRVEDAARAAGVEIVADADADLIVVLGGEGTMLRALRQSLDTGAPVFGINFGRVGFLTTVDAENFETGLARALAGDYVVVKQADEAANGEIVVALLEHEATVKRFSTTWVRVNGELGDQRRRSSGSIP